MNLGTDMNLKDKIAEYPNFPKKGILFRDFSPVLKDPSSLSQIADEFAKHFHPKNVDVFAGIESRGFLLATILALRYNKGIIICLLYTSPSPRDVEESRMPSSA